MQISYWTLGRGIGDETRWAERRATKRIFPPRRHSWKLRRVLTHLPARVFKEDVVDGKLAMFVTALKVSEKQKNKSATVRRYFSQTSFEKPVKSRLGRGHDRLGAKSSGVGTGNDPRLRHNKKKMGKEAPDAGEILVR